MKPIRKNEYVILGACPIAKAIASALTLLCGSDVIECARTEEEAEVLLWNAGDHPARYNATHLVHVTPASELLTEQRLLQTHLRFRPNSRQSATLLGLGPGWSGAIIFVGTPASPPHELTQCLPFWQPVVGYAVQQLPLSICELLHHMMEIQPLYPEHWKSQLKALDCIKPLQQLLHFANEQTVAIGQSLPALKNALDGLLADPQLDLLVEHSVIRTLRQLRTSLDTATAPTSADVARAVRAISQLLRPYWYGPVT